MKIEQQPIRVLEDTSEQSCPKGVAQERWQDLIWELDPSTCYGFAVMAGLAAPLMGLASDLPVVVNFFGGSPQERRTVLELAISTWMDPSEIEDSLVNVSWQDMGKGFGFSYSPDAEAFSVDEIKQAAGYGDTRMAIVCGTYPLDEEAYLDESIGGSKVIVLNLDILSLNVRGGSGKKAGAVEATLSNIRESYTGQFLMQFMCDREPRIDGIGDWIMRQAQYEYEDDLSRIVRCLQDDEPEVFYRIPSLMHDQVLSILSIIKAITVIAIDEEVVPDVQHCAVFDDLYSHVIHGMVVPRIANGSSCC